MTDLPPFVIKVCGVTCEEDAVSALESGANALGFNFYPSSPRYIAPERAQQIMHSVGGSYIRVGVFVNATEFPEINLDVAQVHGRFTLPLPNRRMWRALPMTESVNYPSQSSTEAFLLDSPTPAFGGSGRTFDWSLAQRFPYRKIIAGGLDATNVTAAISAASPWGVDSCSRLESSPGRKDSVRVRDFIQAAHSAFLNQTRPEQVLSS